MYVIVLDKKFQALYVRPEVRRRFRILPEQGRDRSRMTGLFIARASLFQKSMFHRSNI